MKKDNNQVEHIALVPEFPQNSQIAGLASYQRMTDTLIANAAAAEGNVLVVLRANWHPDISDLEITGALDFLRENLPLHNRPTALKIAVYNVPGALELPLILKHIAKNYPNLPVVAFGVVLRGETAHFDLVCTTSNQALMQVALESNLAFGNGLLTCENKQQAEQRAYQKGRDSVHAALSLYAHYHQFETKNCIESHLIGS